MSHTWLVRIAVGLALVGAVIAYLGPATFWHQVLALRWVVPILVATGLVKHAIRTLAWRAALAADGVPVPFGRLFGVRIAAHGVAFASGLDLVVSEPLKAWLLRRDAPARDTVPATVVETGLYWVVSLALTTAGALLAVATLADRPSLAAGAVGAVAALSLVVWFMLGRRALVPAIAHRARLWTDSRPAWAGALAQAAGAESEIRTFRDRHPAAIGTMLVLGLLVQLILLLEVGAVLAIFGIGFDLVHLIEIEAAGRLVKMFTFYIPGRIGADEVGSAGAFLLLGLSPGVGISLALARRLQALSWAGLGFLWLAAEQRAVAASANPATSAAPVVFPVGATTLTPRS